jgi:hypothetical protein
MDYLADIFELNKKMQGPPANILTCTDKINGFKNKIQLWKDVVKMVPLRRLVGVVVRILEKNY